MRHLRRTIQRLIRKGLSGGQKGNSAPREAEPDDFAKRLAKTHRDAAAMLTDWPTVTKSAYKNALVKTSREKSSEIIIEFTTHFLRELQKRGYPMFPFEFYRSPERQARLKKQGVSNAGPGSSPHQWGLAVDIVHFGRYWDLTRKEWEIIGAIGKEVARRRNIPIIWGGDFKSLWDPAHWEIAHWREIRTHKRNAEAGRECGCHFCTSETQLSREWLRKSL